MRDFDKNSYIKNYSVSLTGTKDISVLKAVQIVFNKAGKHSR